MQSLILMSTASGLCRGVVVLSLAEKLSKLNKKASALKLTACGEGCIGKLMAHGVNSVAFQSAEAKAMIQKGEEDLLIDGALNLIDANSNDCDIRVIEGYGNLGSASTEWRINVELARATNSAGVLLINGKDRDAEDIILEAKLTMKDMASNDITTRGVIVLNANNRDEMVKALEGAAIKLLAVFPAFAQNASLDDKIALAIETYNEDVLNGDLSNEKKLVTPRSFLRGLSGLAKQKKQTIVLPEGNLDRIILAAAELRRQDAVNVVLLGDENEIKAEAARLNVSFDEGVSIANPATDARFDDYANTLYELRKAKGVTEEKARELMADRTYFGTMMVKKGDADGMVSGATTSTAATLRPALQFVKTKPGLKNVTSTFLMCMKDQVMLMGDCAVIPNPTAEQLADVAISSAATAKAFGIDPKIAMLSYSTGTSGSGPDVDLVREATNMVRERAPELAVEGPIQYDAAVSPVVAKTKLPDSKVAGHANVFVFPDLSAGNPGYKAVQRSSGAVAIGPVLQGLNKPVNDLSRGATVIDIVNTVLVTAIQAQNN